jgi:sirohydrochlorin ferrochelatase
VKSQRLLAMSASIVFVVASCGASESGSDVAPVSTVSIVATTLPERSAGDDGDIEQTCAELQVVQDLSDQTTVSTNEILQRVAADPGGASEADTIAAFATLAGEIEALLPETLAAYDRAAAVAPLGIDDEIRALADGTARLTPALVEAFTKIKTADDLANIQGIFAQPELQDAATDAGIASLRLDNFTNPNCGFQFSNS